LLQHKLRAELPCDSPQQTKLVEFCGSHSEVWIQQIDAALDNYLTNKAQIK